MTPCRIRAAATPGEPSELPEGLVVTPVVLEEGPFASWTAIVPSFAPQQVAAGVMRLLMACPLDGPWQFGGIAKPWSWISGGKQAFRCMRQFPDPEQPLAAPAPPLTAWRWPRGLYEIFDD